MGLDTVEIVMEIEEEFQISIPDAEACSITTVGELCAAVKEKMAQRDSLVRTARGAPCLTAYTFYRLRRGLVDTWAVHREIVRPDANLAECVDRRQRRRRWTQMSRAISLELPLLRRPTWVVAILGIAVILATAGAASLSAAPLLASLAVCPVAAMIGFMATIPCATQFPVATVGELCWSVAALNRERLAGPPTAWSDEGIFESVKLILVKQLAVDPSLVTREASIVKDLGAD